MMKRRSVIKGLFGLMGMNTLLSGMPLSFRINLAHASSNKTLLVVFQRGGCDGLNTIIPYTEPNYYQLRPSIAIAPPNNEDAAAAIDINGQFGFHPGLAKLLPIYHQGKMALLPTVHYPKASRSHFSSQYYIESAQQQQQSDGWLNRYLQAGSANVQLRAVGLGNELVQSMRGQADVATLTSIDDFSLQVDDNEQALLLSRLNQVYAQAQQQPTRQLLHRFGTKVLSDLTVVQQVRQQGYTPANDALYPNSQFGRDMSQVAQLIKAGVGLEVATVTVGGWDHHANQGGGESTGAQFGSHVNFAQGISAIYTDLAQLMDNVLILVQTEFGRTVAENGSLGTDHGAGSTWYLIGAGVKGGIHGVWPGLAPDQLAEGRFLQYTVDYRDIYAEVLQQHLAVSSIGQMLPQHSITSLGLFL